MSADPQTVTAPKAASRITGPFRIDPRSYSMIGALAAIWLLFSLLHERFLTPTNLSNLFLQMSVTSI